MHHQSKRGESLGYATREIELHNVEAIPLIQLQLTPPILVVNFRRSEHKSAIRCCDRCGASVVLPHLQERIVDPWPENLPLPAQFVKQSGSFLGLTCEKDIFQIEHQWPVRGLGLFYFKAKSIGLDQSRFLAPSA